MNFQRHPFDPLIMRRREIKARVIRVSYLKMGGVVTDTNCQRASQSLYETIAVSLFARLPPRALLAASPLARDSCSATFFPRIFEQKRDCSQSNEQPKYVGILIQYNFGIKIRFLYKRKPMLHNKISLSSCYLSIIF